MSNNDHDQYLSNLTTLPEMFPRNDEEILAEVEMHLEHWDSCPDCLDDVLAEAEAGEESAFAQVLRTHLKKLHPTKSFGLAMRQDGGVWTKVLAQLDSKDKDHLLKEADYELAEQQREWNERRWNTYVQCPCCGNEVCTDVDW